MPPLEVSIVIPCYNEGAHLADNVAQVCRVMHSSGRSFELIFVEDCSTDDTRRTVERLVAELDDACAIYHERNVGRGGTFMDGARVARGQLVGYLDIDLEVPAAHLIDVIKALDACDVATVDRHYRLTRSPVFLLRHFLSAGSQRLVRWYIDMPFVDSETGFKFFRRGALYRIMDRTRDRHWFWDTEIMMLAYLNGLRVREVPGVFEKRRDKKSTVRVVRDTIEYIRALRTFKKRLENEGHRLLASEPLPGGDQEAVQAALR